MSVVTELERKLEVDREKIINAVRLQTPVEITSYTLPRNMEIYIRKVLTTFLEECHQEHLQDYLIFCLGELLTNAKKANTKRVYFKEMGLDINNPQDYEKGMVHFKEDTLTNIDHYLELQKKAGMYIKLDLQLRGDKVKIEIRNKAKLTVFEKERILSKINGVQKYDTMEEIMDNVIDQTEGAGLGIIIIIQMLQKVGLAKENYQVESIGEETITRIILPCNKEFFSAEEIMSYEFINLQNAVPVIDTHFQQLKNELLSPSYSRKAVFDIIRRDATLSLLLLKSSVKKDSKCDEICKAFDMFTDEELKNIYLNADSEINLVENSGKNEALWEHCRNTAFFAYNLIKNKPELKEKYSPCKIYCAALLNTIGFILLENATPEQRALVKEFSTQYSEPQKIYDIFWKGNAREYLNLIYAKRIGLPDDLSCLISSWNYWEMVPEKLVEPLYTVYLAEMIQYYKEGLIDFYQIDRKPLEYFGITNESQFENFVIRLVQSLS